MGRRRPVGGGRDHGTLRCTATWQSPDGRLERLRRVQPASSSSDSGIGLPGRVLAERRAGLDRGHQAGRRGCREASGRGGIGVRSAAAFPIMGERGTRAVVDLFSRRRRARRPGLMKGMATAGRYIGQHLYRRRVEEAVRRAEALRGAVLESALDCVITMNHEGRIVEFNPAAERTFGYRRAEVVGETRRRDPDSRAAARRPPRRARALPRTGESRILGQRLELTGKRSDGTEFPVEVSIVRIGTRGAADVRRLPARRHRRASAARRARAAWRRSSSTRATRSSGVGLDGTDPRVEPGRRAPLRILGRRGDRHADRGHRSPGPHATRRTTWCAS